MKSVISCQGRNRGELVMARSGSLTATCGSQPSGARAWLRRNLLGPAIVEERPERKWQPKTREFH